jgi:metallophosphoesterase (TIGR00282 family)
MKILFFGDVIGRVGREGLLKVLPALKETHQADLVIVNAENAAHGKGLTPAIAKTFWDAGIDVLTMGNHTFDRKDIGAIIDDPRILRPANYPDRVPGHGSCVVKSRDGIPVAVVQVMGRVHMQPIDSPFQVIDRILPELADRSKIIFVDMHAEITAEKGAMGWHLDGRVSAVIGTHTHVQTADERLLHKGTAFLSDAGPCGPINSIIGGDIKSSLERFLTGLHVPINVAEGDAQVCGCAVDIDETTGKARSITRIREMVPLPIDLKENR